MHGIAKHSPWTAEQKTANDGYKKVDNKQMEMFARIMYDNFLEEAKTLHRLPRATTVLTFVQGGPGTRCLPSQLCENQSQWYPLWFHLSWMDLAVSDYTL
jgi:hypothetical protein